VIEEMEWWLVFTSPGVEVTKGRPERCGGKKAKISILIAY
jgi:hypothetical protein